MVERGLITWGTYCRRGCEYPGFQRIFFLIDTSPRTISIDKKKLSSGTLGRVWGVIGGKLKRTLCVVYIILKVVMFGTSYGPNMNALPEKYSIQDEGKFFLR